MGDQQRKWALFDDHSRYVDRFGLLLVITTIAVITLSLVDLGGDVTEMEYTSGLLAVTVFVAGALLLSLRASGVARRYRLVADIIVILGVLATIVVVLFVVFAETEGSEGPERAFVVPTAWIVLSLLAPILVVARLVRHQQATIKTLLGALTAYLLIALAFNFSYLALDTPENPFFGEVEPTTSFMYFSLVTLTTLGYGDLAPIDPPGRLLSTVEAVIGQVYLVTFVAMIVGFIVAQRQRLRSD